MFVLTAAGVGTGFALAKTAAAAGMGLLGGFAVLALQRGGGLQRPLGRRRRLRLRLRPGLRAGERRRRSSGACGLDPERRAEFGRVALRTGAFLSKWLAIAFLAESLMMAYVPASWVASAVGGGSALAIPLAAVVGVPDVPSTATPQSPSSRGSSRWACRAAPPSPSRPLGAVSCIPAAIAVWALVRRSVFALYLGLGLGGAMLAGLLYELRRRPPIGAALRSLCRGTLRGDVSKSRAAFAPRSAAARNFREREAMKIERFRKFNTRDVYPAGVTTTTCAWS